MLLSLALLFGVLVQTDPYAGERKAYDETYSTGRETFNAAPNAFLVRTISGRKPGRALDVAMGQGRNALWLAAQGWDVTGFDISPVGIAEARREADRRKLRLDAVIAPFQEFDWGREKWDLILFSYYFPEDALLKAWTALKPGGLVVIETFHLDTARIRPIGRGLRDNELVRILQDYRVLHTKTSTIARTGAFPTARPTGSSARWPKSPCRSRAAAPGRAGAMLRVI